jgi:hypothetical protein
MWPVAYERICDPSSVRSFTKANLLLHWVVSLYLIEDDKPPEVKEFIAVLDGETFLY